MSIDFFSPLMLAGLAGVVLPILAHLLSRKKYDVVDWGAMQFLELGRNLRRKFQLEELLLLLLRMVVVAVLVLALARPWLSGGPLTRLVSTQSRDVVLIVDGSYSMGWQGAALTPRAAALARAHEFLEMLQPGDTAALLDARDRVRPVVDPPTRDLERVRHALDALPGPAGTADLPRALEVALKILGRTQNAARDIVLFTDCQAHGWLAGEERRWLLLDELRALMPVPVRVWVMDVGGPAEPAQPHFAVTRLRISRELTVPDLPVRIEAGIRHYAGPAGASPTTLVARRVRLEVDGQPLGSEAREVQIAHGGETLVEFEHRFTSPGAHLVGVALDADLLPGDDRAEAALTVAESLPVLLVDGDPHAEAVRSETFFLKAALTAPQNESPRVRARIVRWDRLSADDLAGQAALVLANVPRLSPELLEALSAYVAAGGGVLWALGDRVDAAEYQRIHAAAPALLPVAPQALVDGRSDAGRISDAGLELPWLRRLGGVERTRLTDVRFFQWWKVVEAAGGEPAAAGRGSAPAGDAARPVVWARLTSGDPLFIAQTAGSGRAVVSAAPLDAEGSTFPAESDFVVCAHELLFHLASGSVVRNVEVGWPLVLPLPDHLPIDDYAFFAPDGTALSPQVSGTSGRRRASSGETWLPGVYRFGPRTGVGGEHGAEYFVVRGDRGESDLSRLDEEQRRRLAGDGRMTFVASIDEWKQRGLTDGSRVELSAALLLVFLGLLVGEVLMTRRLVRGALAAEEPG